MPDEECFYRSVKDGKTSENGENGEKLDGHVSDEEYLMCKKNLEIIWHEKYGWLSRSLFEKRCFVISWCFWKVYWNVYEVDPWPLSLF